MTKEFNNLEEMQKYYVEKTNTYVFKENDEYIDLVIFNFDLNIHSDIEAYGINAYDIIAYDINAWEITACDIDAYNIRSHDISADDIKARDITAWNINARNINAQDIIAYDINTKDIYANDINARNIKANNISYYSVCFAGEDIKCKSIQGRRKNARHFVLDGKLEVEEK